MNNLQFTKDPRKDDIVLSFPDSLYFSEAAFVNREKGSALGTDLLTASIGSRVVGALAWTLCFDGEKNILKIELVEVVPEYRGQYIGPHLIQEAEKINVGEFEMVLGFLSDPFNISSIGMFLKCGFRRMGPYFLIKDAIKI